jgi:hypothetical protein
MCINFALCDVSKFMPCDLSDMAVIATLLCVFPAGYTTPSIFALFRVSQNMAKEAEHGNVDFPGSVSWMRYGIVLAKLLTNESLLHWATC